jgi:hypothetical protein
MENKVYRKIQTVFKRDPATKHKTLLYGQYSLPEFKYLSNCLWDFTEKVDGTNIRLSMEDGRGRIDGRNEKSQVPRELQLAIQRLLPEGKVEKFFGHDEFCLYGEGYGAGVQKGGGNYRDDPSFVLFDVKMGEWWLQREDVNKIAVGLGIAHVPIIGRGTLHDMCCRAMKGIKSTWGDFEAEGIVARPAVDLQTRGGHRIITKIKCKDFAREAAQE